MESPTSQIYSRNMTSLTPEQVASWYAVARKVRELAAIAGSGKATQEMLEELRGSDSALVRATVAGNIALSEKERTDWILAETAPSVLTALLRVPLTAAALVTLTTSKKAEVLEALGSSLERCELTASPASLGEVVNFYAEKDQHDALFMSLLEAAAQSGYQGVDMRLVSAAVLKMLRVSYYHNRRLLRRVQDRTLWHTVVRLALEDGVSVGALQNFFRSVNGEDIFAALSDEDALAILPSSPRALALGASKQSFPAVAGVGILSPKKLFTCTEDFLNDNYGKLVADIETYGWEQLKDGVEVVATAWSAIVANPKVTWEWVETTGLALVLDSESQVYFAAAVVPVLRRDPELTGRILTRSQEAEAHVAEDYRDVTASILRALIDELEIDSGNLDIDKLVWLEVMKKAPLASPDRRTATFWTELIGQHRLMTSCPELTSLSTLRDQGWPSSPGGELLANGIAVILTEVGYGAKGQVDAMLLSYSGTVGDFLDSVRGVLYKETVSGPASKPRPDDAKAGPVRRSKPKETRPARIRSF